MERKRRGETVYELIRAGIVDGTYSPGGKLPSEADLCAHHDVSRPVIREALARLRVEGLIVSRQGSGTYVSEEPNSRKSGSGFAPVRNINDIDQCFDFRLSLEGEAAYHAAQNRTEADLQVIENALQHVVEALETGGEVDVFAFYVAIAEATHIHFFPSVMNSMRRHVMVGMKLGEEFSHLAADERSKMVHTEQRAIVRAIRARDGEGARSAMRKHINQSRRRLFLG